MESELSRLWWLPVVRGVAAILFGVLAFVWPGITLLVLVILFGAYAIIDGILALYTAVAGSARAGEWWSLLLEGVLGIGAGIVTFVWPGITGLALLFLIAIWAIVTGLFEIIAAVRLRKQIEGEWLLGFSGVLSIVFGVLLLVWPASGALAIAWLIGIYAIIFGVTMLMLGIRLHRNRRGAPTETTFPAGMRPTT